MGRIEVKKPAQLEDAIYALLDDVPLSMLAYSDLRYLIEILRRIEELMVDGFVSDVVLSLIPNDDRLDLQVRGHLSPRGKVSSIVIEKVLWGKGFVIDNEEIFEVRVVVSKGEMGL
jgi:hypothetical protein